MAMQNFAGLYSHLGIIYCLAKMNVELFAQMCFLVDKYLKGRADVLLPKVG